ncbi:MULTISPECIES: aldehyde dehydrogenase family protein [unclassified Psychrobacillus]|uniref:aldehyde dehydrogenase family protein n=1 Tax=unclassified Psychrobacillus TaxID=2636677 RepID=UPI00146D8ACB|nr:MULTISPECIES: aldehyde dehydrogenase family protein [unclassified Psychrobacillus]MCM3357898.1 aldehyde dehydrogenase family protein [Psychrobacillus sp. MER TA 171]NME05269.1 aldehyde dehydrogenase family protein [Psychrobacillus sp. BL-248-WT-3]
MKLTNFINGKWQEGEASYTAVLNPANGEQLAEVRMSTKEDVDVAVEAAVKAQKKWALVPAPKRADYLYEIGRLMKERKEHLAQVLTKEMGKVIEEGRGEVQEGIDMAFYMAGEGRRLFGETTPSELADKFAMSVRAPIGVVGLITPWNFPVAIATWKSFPALVAGNAFIWKPATETPMMAFEMAKIFEEVGLPSGVANVVFGSGSEVGTAMIEHKDVKVISFTGSTDTGSKVAELGGRHLKKVSLEMGGKNAVIVMEDADLNLAVDGILWSAFGTAGQRCTACSRVIVHKDVKKELEKMLLERMEKLTIGDGMDETVKVGPVINKAALEKIHSYIQIGKEEGANLVVGGTILQDGDLAKGNYYAPTLFTDVKPNMRIAQEEIFGPVVSLIEVESLEEAIEVNNGVKFGLSSSIFSRDINKIFRAQRDLDTGIVYVNAGTTGAEIHLPFGGTKGTGNGHRDSGVAALDVYTEWKSIYIDYSGKLQRAQIDTE